MKPWLCLALCLSIGCSRTPMNPTPSDVDKSKPPPAVIPVAQPTPEKKNDTPVKDIAKPRENPEIVRNNERGIIRGIVRREDGANSGIAGAVVWLKPTGKTTLQPPPVETVRLSVEQDEYRPHVLLAQKGGSLELRTVEERSDFQASGAVVLLTLVGGMGTVLGPVVGAFVVVAMEHYLAGLGSWVSVIQGGIFTVCVLAFRRGIVGQIGVWMQRRRRASPYPG